VKTLHLKKSGVTLAYDDAGTGIPVVLLHAFPFDRGMWQPQLAAIPLAGFRVLAPDFPGFGNSLPGDKPFSIDGASDLVAEFLDSLGIAWAVVGGLSLGGYVAMAFARRHAGKLIALILADTRAAPDDEAAREGRDKMIAIVKTDGPNTVAVTMLPKVLCEETRTGNHPAKDLAESIAIRQSEAGVIAVLLALRDRPDAAPELANITVPTLVLVGEHDELTPPLNAARLAGSIRDSELHHIPKAGHLSNIENPDAFNAAVIGFLKKLK